ncbi:MAG: sulfite exporter TauE/SafE family protein [Deltaproteobacteria bacterium]|nr:sulfite exporter TauE/SafE family protein [Deltaproteobacteria bacterium]
MGRIIGATVVILIIAAIMAMTGRGGGNFYVPALVAFGVPMHQAATTGQLILVLTAASALLIFQKKRTVDWKLALVIDPPTDVMALIGGYSAHLFSGSTLKFIFAGLLVLAGLFMLRPGKEKPLTGKKPFGFWHRKFGQHEYVVNLWLAIPITAVTGLVAGAVGISGGSFKVPLMVLACGVPMRIAVGTSSAMVAVTALMGFVGHSAGGDFTASWALPLAAVAIAGGLAGGMFSLKTTPRNLKKIFALTTLVAALFMFANAFLSLGE